MLKKAIILLIFACGLLIGLAACGPSQADIQSTEASFQAATQQVLDTRATKQALFTANAQATLRIEQTIQAQDTLRVEQTAEAANTTATAEAKANTMANSTATAVQMATETAAIILEKTSTANAIVQSTAQAQPMLELVTTLANEGYLSTTEGQFYDLVDFDESWAQLGWYWFFPTNYSPTDFVIRASAAWDSASNTPDPWTTGCGFVFREDGIPNHYLTYLGIDGNVYFSRYYKDKYSLIGSDYYGTVGLPKGSADIVLAVEGSWVTFLVNGEPVLHRQDTSLVRGKLDYTLVSGTNKDYGTHCRMTNIELWVIK
jgi:uncharacterized surface protein with fasciclin (FAS1) repeats